MGGFGKVFENVMMQCKGSFRPPALSDLGSFIACV